jgi:hypothetical protein
LAIVASFSGIILGAILDILKEQVEGASQENVFLDHSCSNMILAFCGVRAPVAGRMQTQCAGMDTPTRLRAGNKLLILQMSLGTIQKNQEVSASYIFRQQTANKLHMVSSLSFGWKTIMV